MLLALALAGCDDWGQRFVAAPGVLPYWQVSSLWQLSPAPAGCASVNPWVSKSGKTGLGLTVELRGRDPACAPAIVEASLAVAGQRISAVPSTPGDPAPWYLPFLFDNDRLWRAGVQDARVTLLVRTEGKHTAPVSIPLRQLGVQPHNGVIELYEREAGCARVDAQLLDLGEPIVLALDLSAARPGCRVRFAGVSAKGTGDPGRLGLAPATDVWSPLPVRWVFSFHPARPLSFKDGWGGGIQLQTEDGKLHTIHLGVGPQFRLGIGGS